jgi:mannose-6-phosphate isomerase
MPNKKSHTKPGARSTKKPRTTPGNPAAAAGKPIAQPGSGRVNVVKIPKPWGHETIWARSDRYVGKILHINAGQELSVQYHDRKDETAHLLSGRIVYRVQGDSGSLKDVQLKLGESFRITPGTIHQMVALTDCDVLEVSTPELDDVVRLTDKYGRAGTSAP